MTAISPFSIRTPNPQVQSSSVTNNSNLDGQLKFFLKLDNNSTQDGQQSNKTTSSFSPSSLQKQNLTINLNIQQGQEPIKKLPIKAIVSKETTLKNLQICIDIGNDTLQCQPLSHNKTTLNLINQQ